MCGKRRWSCKPCGYECCCSFVLIGEYYRRRTGKNAVSCPIYVDKKHRKLQFGAFVTYGKERASAECTRIVGELCTRFLQMAEQS